MNAQQTRPGWYPDPAGAHQLRFFDGRWTERVADGGTETTEYRPTPTEVPPAWLPTAASPTAALPTDDDRPEHTNSRRRWLIATGVAGLAAVAATVVVIAHSASAGSFCGDYARLGTVYASMRTNPDNTELIGQADRLIHRMADEAPASARADFQHVAAGMDQALSTGLVGPDLQAAGDRADVAAERQCGTTGT